MQVHRLDFTLSLPVGLDEAWDFFSNPLNLNAITPDDLQFEIISGADEKMFAGQLITYRIRPLLNLPMCWVTEITHCADKQYFIDEQRFGPYKFWHHRHQFRKVENGVLMTDTLHYALPYGIVGRLGGLLFIHDRIHDIFRFREKKLKSLFG